MKRISIVTGCFNEVDNVEPLVQVITSIMKEQHYEYEIIITDNCSTDGTQEVLKKIASTDKRVKVLFNNRNYGIDGRSDRNTFKYVTGDVVIGLASDFQDPPELIPEFIKYWEEGYHVVCGQKSGSKEGHIKYFLRSLYYRIIKTFSEIPQYEHISGMVLFDREVLNEFLKTDYDFYFRFAIADMGYDIKMVQYVQQERRSGKSSYNVWRYLTFAINSMIITSTAPLRIMTVLGVLLSIASFLIGCVYLILKIVYWDSFVAGTAPILIGLFFIGSVQMFFLGILGEYISVILRKVTKRPEVIIRERLNIDGE